MMTTTTTTMMMMMMIMMTMAMMVMMIMMVMVINIGNRILDFLLQQMANNMKSPRQQYPGLAATIKLYLKRFVGIATTFSKEALLTQDVEHLMDVCGIDTPHGLQRK